MMNKKHKHQTVSMEWIETTYHGRPFTIRQADDWGMLVKIDPATLEWKKKARLPQLNLSWHGKELHAPTFDYWLREGLVEKRTIDLSHEHHIPIFENLTYALLDCITGTWDVLPRITLDDLYVTDHPNYRSFLGDVHVFVTDDSPLLFHGLQRDDVPPEFQAKWDECNNDQMRRDDLVAILEEVRTLVVPVGETHFPAFDEFIARLRDMPNANPVAAIQADPFLVRCRERKLGKVLNVEDFTFVHEMTRYTFAGAPKVTKDVDGRLSLKTQMGRTIPPVEAGATASVFGVRFKAQAENKFPMVLKVFNRGNNPTRENELLSTLTTGEGNDCVTAYVGRLSIEDSGKTYHGIVMKRYDNNLKDSLKELLPVKEEHVPQLLRVVTTLLADMLQLQAVGVLHCRVTEENFVVELDGDRKVKRVVVANLGDCGGFPESPEDDEMGTFVLIFTPRFTTEIVTEFKKGDDLHSLGCIVSGFFDTRPYFESIYDVNVGNFRNDPFPEITEADQGVDRVNKIEVKKAIIMRHAQFIKAFNEERRQAFNQNIATITNPTVRAFLEICLDFVNGTMCEAEKQMDWSDVVGFINRFNALAQQLGQAPVPFAVQLSH